MTCENETVFYIAQECAMAPGIVKGWPDFIPHPFDHNGRLKKATKEEIRAAVGLTKKCLVDLNKIEQAVSIIKEKITEITK